MTHPTQCFLRLKFRVQVLSFGFNFFFFIADIISHLQYEKIQGLNEEALLKATLLGMGMLDRITYNKYKVSIHTYIY